MKPPPHKKQRPGAESSRARQAAHKKSAAGGTVRDSEHRPKAVADREPQLVQLEKPIYGGAFLGRVQGKAVFVPLALPGERARVRMVEEKRGYATAEIEERLNAAPERVAARCPYFGACGGCQYQHADYAAQLRYKQAILRETLERGGVRAPAEIEVLAGEPWAYRNRIRLAFDGAGNPGYRGRRSHEVIAIAECPIAAPLLVKAALEFARIARQLAPALKPKEIALFCDAEETALLVSVFCARSAKVRVEEMARALREQIPALRGMELVSEDGRAARAFAQWGERSLHYDAAGFEYRVDSGAFFQVNRRLVDALVERVTAGRSGVLAWDLFAGVGLFARRLAAAFERVVAVESAPAAADALVENLSTTGATAVRTSTLEFLRSAVTTGRSVPDSIVPDLIVVDPPRTGLGAETTALLGEMAAPTLVYVSCDPATLARDLRALVASGYEIGRVTVADLFPQTFHLETIVDLRHQSRAAGQKFVA